VDRSVCESTVPITAPTNSFCKSGLAEDWRRIAPHELVGRLPKPYASTCGRRATSSGKPCKVRVPMWGDACPTHAHIDAETLAVYEKP
jgi:hypothetical protein